MITKILGGATAVFAILAALFFKLYLGEVHDYERYRAQTEAGQQLANDAAEERDRNARENTATVAGIYGARLAAVEHSYNSRLARYERDERVRQQAAANRATAQAVAASTRLPDGQSADGGPDPAGAAGEVCKEVKVVFRRLEVDCAQTTTMLYGLQDYVLEVCK